MGRRTSAGEKAEVCFIFCHNLLIQYYVKATNEAQLKKTIIFLIGNTSQ